LIQIKELIGRGNGVQPAVIDRLHGVAALAESFTRARQKSKKIFPEFADALDREGVNLWNQSIFIKDDQEKRSLVAALRHAGFRLIEAGIESNPPLECMSPKSLFIYHY
ncbi:hypothetical protein BS47DRAFT_1303271, partial [Hydnum rufescens UP504]